VLCVYSETDSNVHNKNRGRDVAFSVHAGVCERDTLEIRCK